MSVRPHHNSKLSIRPKLSLKQLIIKNLPFDSLLLRQNSSSFPSPPSLTSKHETITKPKKNGSLKQKLKAPPLGQQQQKQQDPDIQATTDVTQLTMENRQQQNSINNNNSKQAANNNNNNNLKNSSFHSSSSEEDLRSRDPDSVAKSKQKGNQPYQTDDSNNKNGNTSSNHNNFIRRLFACGGYCARSGSRRQNLSSSNSAYGLSKSTTNIQTKSSQNNNKIASPTTEKPSNQNGSNNTINNIGNKNSQSHSDLNKQLANSTNSPENIKQSYEALIDKILSTPTKLRQNNVSQAVKASLLSSSKTNKKFSNDLTPNSTTSNNSSQQNPKSDEADKQQRSHSAAVKASAFKPRKNILNENLKKLESDNHKLFRKTETITDKV